MRFGYRHSAGAVAISFVMSVASTREDEYLYRAVDSIGQTIDFLLTAKRDAAAAKRFLRKALTCPGNPMPRVINGGGPTVVEGC